MKMSGTALLGLVLQHKGAKARNSYSCPNPREEQLGSLNGVAMWAGPWIGQETKLKWSVYPLGGWDHV